MIKKSFVVRKIRTKKKMQLNIFSFFFNCFLASFWNVFLERKSIDLII